MCWSYDEGAFDLLPSLSSSAVSVSGNISALPYL